MAVTTAQLRSELLTDPTGLGYAPFIAAGSDSEIVEAVNRIRATISVFRDDVAASELLAALVKTDWNGLAAGDKQLFQAVVSAQRLDMTSAALRGTLIALFPAGSATRTNLTAAASREGSRAEKLWGLGASVSIADVALALRG